MPSPSLASITGFDRSLVVGVGGLVVSNDQNATLTTYSLGSCLGLTVYDPVTKSGGLLHAMLPDSTINPKKAVAQPAMFVDTGVPALFRASYQLRAEKQRMQVCVAGGAQFLDPTGFFNIGLRNFNCLKELLRKNGVTLLAEEIGGTVSRTIYLKLATGEVRLKISGQANETILFKG
jgi:chemotaxis protein CheD